jgi:hypothetical protein
MITLTGDFHVFSSGITTGFTAKRLIIRHIAQARYVRTLPALLIRHLNFILSSLLTFFTAILDVVPFTVTTTGLSGGSAGRSVFDDYVALGDACRAPNSWCC